MLNKKIKSNVDVDFGEIIIQTFYADRTYLCTEETKTDYTFKDIDRPVAQVIRIDKKEFDEIKNQFTII